MRSRRCWRPEPTSSVTPTPWWKLAGQAGALRSHSPVGHHGPRKPLQPDCTARTCTVPGTLTHLTTVWGKHFSRHAEPCTDSTVRPVHVLQCFLRGCLCALTACPAPHASMDGSALRNVDDCMLYGGTPGIVGALPRVCVCVGGGGGAGVKGSDKLCWCFTNTATGRKCAWQYVQDTFIRTCISFLLNANDSSC